MNAEHTSALNVIAIPAGVFADAAFEDPKRSAS